jgi:hypothetical protein
MVRVVRSLVVVLLTGALWDCGVGLNFWQDAVIQVDVPAGPKTFTQAQTINFAADSSHPGHLTGLRIPEVRVRINNVAAANKATSLSGSIVISDSTDASFPPVTLPFDALKVTEGAETIIYPDGAAVNRLQPVVLAQHPLKIEHRTTLSALPAHFQLTSSLHILAEVAL